MDTYDTRIKADDKVESPFDMTTDTRPAAASDTPAEPVEAEATDDPQDMADDVTEEVTRFSDRVAALPWDLIGAFAGGVVLALGVAGLAVMQQRASTPQAKFKAQLKRFDLKKVNPRRAIKAAKSRFEHLPISQRAFYDREAKKLLKILR